MAFYSMSPRSVLDISSRMFWMLNKNIDRLSAERDMRSSAIAVQAQSGEGIKDLFEGLQKQMGSVVEFDTEAMVKRTIAKDDNNRADLKDLAHIGDLG
jgi:hypothetical protein